MSALHLTKFDTVLDDGQPVHYCYDKEGDILEIVFRKARATCAVELTDNIILRLDLEKGEPLSLSFISYSHLVQPTKVGPQSFRLKLDSMAGEIRQKVVRIITSSPVNQFLKVSSYGRPRAKRPVPITYVERMPAFVQAQRQVA